MNKIDLIKILLTYAFIDMLFTQLFQNVTRRRTKLLMTTNFNQIKHFFQKEELKQMGFISLETIFLVSITHTSIMLQHVNYQTKIDGLTLITVIVIIHDINLLCSFHNINNKIHQLKNESETKKSEFVKKLYPQLNAKNKISGKDR